MKGTGQLVLSKSDIELNRIQKIIEFHEEIKNLMINSLEKAFTIGFLLSEQKKGMTHGEFIPWIEKNLPFGERTARNYRMVYKNKEMLNRKAIADLNGAYLLLKENRRQKKQTEIEELIEKQREKVKYVKTNSGFTIKKTIEEPYPGATTFYADECVESEGREAEKNKAPWEVIDYFNKAIMYLQIIGRGAKIYYKKYGDAIYGSYDFNWNDGKIYLYPEFEKAFKSMKLILDKIIKSKVKGVI